MAQCCVVIFHDRRHCRCRTSRCSGCDLSIDHGRLPPDELGCFDCRLSQTAAETIDSKLARTAICMEALRLCSQASQLRGIAMELSSQSAKRLFKQPGTFALAVVKQFRANQGILLAGAVAYYT